MTIEAWPMIMNAHLAHSPLSPGPPAALPLLMRQSVIPLSRSVFVRSSVKGRVLLSAAEELLCEAIVRHRSYSGWPTRLKLHWVSSLSPLT